MKYTIEQLSYVVPAISIGFLFIITSINVYFKIRRRFPATVNCWFCNENSKVPYDDLNKWTCPKCEQYNGFSEDGDYNCDIPAQRSVKLNKWKTSSFSSMNGSISGRLTPMNGLCEPCNRNQELKVQQLASFEPENEAYFDEEIEEYRVKLEQAYRLCPRCERHLKRSLNKVKTNILGSKLRQIGTKGLQAFNLSLNQKANKVIVYRKQLTFARISLGALIVISLLQLFTTTNQINITKPKLDSVFNAATTTSILTVFSYISAVKILILQSIQYILALPYISLAVTCVQMLVKYVYTYVNGDIWKLIKTEFLELADSSVSGDELNPEFSTLTTNVSGCFLSIFLLFLFGLGWGPVLSLLLWSFSMVLPTITVDETDLGQALVLDFVQLILVWSSVLLSLVNCFTLPTRPIQSNTDKNSSFHRIDSEMNSDVSDDSEAESELNSSLRSNMSSASKRSLWNETRVLNSTIASKAPSHYSTNSMRQRSYGISSQSIASTKPASPEMNTSFGSERFYKGSQFDLTRDKFNGSQRSLMAAQSQSDIFGRQQCTSAISFHALNKTFTNVDPSVRSSSRNSFYDIPNDFESGITQLSISGAKHSQAKNHSRVFGSTDLLSDALRHRKSVLSPSRLSLNEAHHPVNQSSWLAGGYWNSTSPQKKSTAPPPSSLYGFDTCTMPKEAFPAISRASSKSSGFESRENSLCDDTEVERTFLFPEPTSLATKANNGLIKPKPHKPMSLVNRFSGDHSRQSASCIPAPTPDVFTNNSIGEIENSLPNFSMLSRSFGRFTLQQPAQQQPLPQPSHFQHHNNVLKSDQSITSTLNQFARHNRDLPMRTFQRGSLIKLHDQMSMDH
ncbi:uncharacterized protein LOC129576561 [Sitodiplosis mosellana]|uniref:uncharacterized protein LOC129576561 n=1 Tax=Sitodiplosis mosellana TaxID=263140 RepID=UPI002444F05E|nr:uncharacterized protein LOC129576561 [Sitodiplosis mosellana]